VSEGPLLEPHQEKAVRLGLLFREAGVISPDFWQTLTSRLGIKADKSAAAIFQQDVSLATFRDFLFMDVNPFKGSRTPDLQKLASGHLKMLPDELRQILERNQPDIPRLCHLLLSLGLISVSQLELALEEADKRGISPYEALLNHELVTTATVEKIIDLPDNDVGQENRIHNSADILVFNNLITREDFMRAVESSAVTKAPLHATFENLRVLSQEEILSALVRGMEIPVVELTAYSVARDLVDRFPEEFLRRQHFLPLSVQDNCIELATADPFNLALADAVSVLTGKRTSLIFTSHTDLVSRLDTLFPGRGIPVSEMAPLLPGAGRPSGGGEAAVRVGEAGPAGPTRLISSMDAVQVVTQIVEGAITSKATDIHIEPMETEIRVRFRVDGIMHTVMRVPADLQLAVVSRIKVLAQMNVTERRRPQDGHFSLNTRSGNYDFRISTLPAFFGEKIVMRVLDSRRVMTGLADLGMSQAQVELTDKLIRRPHGLILVTGPTGSGKTSTLYAALSAVNKDDINIITIEDPVEYQIPGINQVQVEANIDMTFAASLRAALRQDPDVIMVGEIRDPETAGIAIRASLTGHLVFSTLHTNTAVLAISALAHMGIQRYLIGSATAGIIAQRLVRQICLMCKKAVAPPKSVLRDLGLPENSRKKFYAGTGCKNCFGSGYLGRTALFEVVEIHEDIRRGIAEEMTDVDLAELVARDHPTLMASGVARILEGVTTPDEVLRAVALA
jgi:type IV pilus assembly protein PilB